MKFRTIARGLAAGATALAFAFAAQAADKTIKIGVIYDYTGPLAGGGSELQARGAKIMIDYINAQGGVEGYKIEPIYADAQSKPDVAINEAVRLIEQENVDMLLGFLQFGPVRAGGRPRRAAQEVHVDHHLHLAGGAPGPEPEICVPPAGAWRHVRHVFD